MCVEASLEWEMFEQYFVWQLLSAEGCSVRELLPLLTELDVTGMDMCVWVCVRVCGGSQTVYV